MHCIGCCPSCFLSLSLSSPIVKASFPHAAFSRGVMRALCISSGTYNSIACHDPCVLASLNNCIDFPLSTMSQRVIWLEETSFFGKSRAHQRPVDHHAEESWGAREPPLVRLRCCCCCCCEEVSLTSQLLLLLLLLLLWFFCFHRSKK